MKMTPNARLARRTILALFLVYGVLGGYFAGHGNAALRIVDFVFLVALTPLPYIWYVLDAREQNFRRTSGLGAAIIMFTVLAVPYYLARSRPPGKRLGAVLRFVGFVALVPVLQLGAALPFFLLSGQIH